MSAFADFLDDIYGDPDFGVPAIYTPLVGSPVAVTMIWGSPDEDVRLGGSMSTQLRKNAGQVRVSELAEPERGATMTVDGTVYTIAGRARDDLGIEWTLDLKAS